MECVRQCSRPPDGFGREVTMLWQRTLLQSPCGVRGEPECHHKNPRCLRRGVVSVRDYSYLHLEAINYSYVHLYKGDSLQLKTTMSSATLNKIPGKYKWASSNPQMVSVSSNGRITAKKGNSSKMTTVVLVKGTTAIAECEVLTAPRIKFSTVTRTAKKGTTLKVCVPDHASNCKSNNKSVVKADDRFWHDE